MASQSTLMLPEAESLPDGFTEGDTGESQALPSCWEERNSHGCGEKLSPPREQGTSSLFSQLRLGSPRSASRVDDVAVSGEMVNFPAELGNSAERMRRFPVPLAWDPGSHADVRSLEQDVQGGSYTGMLQEQPTPDGRFVEPGKKKRRVKELKLLLAAAGPSTDEKLQLLQAKYLQLVAESETVERELLVVRQRLLQENSERIALIGELSKNNLLREKLESLCRELQRQNKILLDDSKRSALEEQQRRQELSTSFHTTIQDISLKLDQQENEQIRQAKENESLREKLKHFAQQYELREEQFANELKAKTIEHQVLEVKLRKQQELFHQEEAKAKMYSEQISQLLLTEQDLRSQLALYGDKFEQFQDTLTKSNEVFSSFKQEMEKMSKTIKALEKENYSLKSKCQKTDFSLIELVEERASLRKQLDTSTNQKKKLESLCRVLQTERKQRSTQTPEATSPEPLQENTAITPAT